MAESKIDISVCNDVTMPVGRQPDGEGLCLYFTGGLLATNVDDDRWMIEPILDGGRPCRKGHFTRSELQAFSKKLGITPIAFQRIAWNRGEFYSGWTPLITGRSNHTQGPSDLWMNIASNLGRSRKGAKLRKLIAPTHQEIAEILDERTEEERLSLSISLSLRSMNISVEQIADFYNEQLTNFISSGSIDGRRAGGTQDQSLFAHVHSFFLHLGAARDYLGALIAARVGKYSQNVDSMARLVESLRQGEINIDSMLILLNSRGFLKIKQKKSTHFELSGWLKEASELRNMFIHRRPYGALHVEALGYTAAIAANAGIYRYVRPIRVDEEAEKDVLDVVAHHYRQATVLFQDMAEASGWDRTTPTLTRNDITSINI